MTSFRFRVGTYTTGDMGEQYEVTQFPTQPDQMNRWYSPVTPSERWSEFDFVTDGGLTGTRRHIGKWNGSWYFNAVTPGQVTYLRGLIFPRAAVTIMTYADGFGWITLNCIALYNDPVSASVSKPGSGRLQDYRMDFIEGVLAPAPPEPEPEPPEEPEED